MILWFLAAAIAAPTFTAEIAPDQPIPHVFADEPLVLELRSTEAATATVHVTLQRPQHEPIVLAPQTVALRKDAQQWLTIASSGLAFGSYTAQIVMASGAATASVDQSFSVISRPTPAAKLNAVANLGQEDFDQLIALADIPVKTVRLSVQHPQAEAILRACAATAMTVALVIDPDPLPPATGSAEAESPPPVPGENEARIEQLAHDHGAIIASWEIATAEPDLVLRTAAALRRAQTRVPILADIASIQDIERLLSTEAGGVIAGLVVTGNIADEDILAFRAAAEQAGFERMPLHLLPDPNAYPADLEAIHALIRRRGIRTGMDVIPAEFAYNNGHVTPLYVYLNAMAHRLNGAAYVGPIDTKGATAHLFRTKSQWILVCWNAEAAETSIRLGEARELRLTDACNNSLPLEPDGDNVELAVGPEPLYLSGQGGNVIAAAATAAAAAEANALRELAKRTPSLLEPYMGVFEALAKGKPVDRLAFVGLVQVLPEFERQWHQGQVPRNEAVPALAACARLARVLATLEQEKGEEFVEPFQNVVARCGEFQSVYLMSTGADGPHHERGDWIMQEINRLVSEAEELRDAGRTTEAVGVATLAEARARALEFAAAAKPSTEPGSAVPSEAGRSDSGNKA